MVPAQSFTKVGDEGMEIHSNLEERGFILPNEDIDAESMGIKGISGCSMPRTWQARLVIKS
jgi:hypothetical protein